MELLCGKCKLYLKDSGQIERIVNMDQVIFEECDENHFIRLVVNGQVEESTSLKELGDTIEFGFESDIKVIIKVMNKEIYTTFEVIEIENPNELDIEILLWGPIKTSSYDTVGDIIGAVYDDTSAFLIQGLNIKTLGGWPGEYKQYGAYGEGRPYGTSVSTNDYNLCAAWNNEIHKVLQAYTRDFTRLRTGSTNDFDEQEILPLEGDDGSLIGSQIALFGCSTMEVLDIISQLEINEGLPHPIIEGEWGKVTDASTQGYLITTFTKDQIQEAVDWTKRAGFKYLYHNDIFRSWGHFRIGEFFDNSYDVLKEVSDYANSRDVYLGTHTLTNFLADDDEYVSPVPSKEIQQVGKAVLLEDIDDECTEIYVNDVKHFIKDTSGRGIKCIRIGDEIIRYHDVYTYSQERFCLTGVVRGDRGTVKSCHKKGERVYRLPVHYYDKFFPNIYLQSDLSKHLADAYHLTGLKQISFDGLEGCRVTGHDTYAMNKFVMEWYNGLDNHDYIINDASRLTHYLWHVHSRMNWGEPWGAKMREGMIDARIANQTFYENNFFPKMLGWFKIFTYSDLLPATSLNDIEWMLSKAAGFNSGFALTVGYQDMKDHGISGELLDAVRIWESARKQNAFTKSQRDRLKQKDTEWHLEEVEENKKWELYQVHHPQKPLVKSFNDFQPGSTGVDWHIENVHPKQNLRFILRAKDGIIDQPGIITHSGNMVFDVKINDNEFLVCEGDMVGKHYDKNWNLLETITGSGDQLELNNGGNIVSFSANFINESEKGIAEFTVITRNHPEIIEAGNGDKFKNVPTIKVNYSKPFMANSLGYIDLAIESSDEYNETMVAEIEITYDPSYIEFNSAVEKEGYTIHTEVEDSQLKVIIVGSTNKINAKTNYFRLLFNVLEKVQDTTIDFTYIKTFDSFGEVGIGDIQEEVIKIDKCSLSNLAKLTKTLTSDIRERVIKSILDHLKHK